MHLATKLLLATLGAFIVGAVFWRVVDNRRAKKHRERRLAREARDREAAEMQMTGTDPVGEPAAPAGERVEAEIVDAVEAIDAE